MMFMMLGRKRILLFCLIFISSAFNAQILESYPNGTEFYKGGRVEFYRQFHDILLKQKLKPCDDKNEFYHLEVVVYPDATIKFVKQDSSKFSNSKCTYDLTRVVLKFMKDWSPAEVDGKKEAALVKIPMFADDLFEKYVDSYLPEMYSTVPEYEGGIQEFRKKVANSIDTGRFVAKTSVRFTVETTFAINAEGKMEDVKLSRETDNKEFNEMILTAIKSIKKKWKPATYHNIPVKYHFRLPLTFNFD
ncbi:energy transducer TonB family protein [Chryseobacterium sp. MMS23-Vi53]|uniref:energy transducer TonB family protein n=1 Tax=Chryseobacterium sp. MMS23-Vi53 TaxID=3386644 RepID=UPI0039EC977B